jgi:hypothetical protein
MRNLQYSVSALYSSIIDIPTDFVCAEHSITASSLVIEPIAMCVCVHILSVYTAYDTGLNLQ